MYIKALWTKCHFQDCNCSADPTHIIQQILSLTANKLSKV